MCGGEIDRDGGEVVWGCNEYEGGWDGYMMPAE
jgi:hypothetical protein